MRSVRVLQFLFPRSPPPSQPARAPYLHPQTLTRDPIRPPVLPLPPHAYASHSYSHPPPPPRHQRLCCLQSTNAHLCPSARTTPSVCGARRPPPHTPHTPLPSPCRLTVPDTRPDVHEHAHAADAARDAHTTGDGAERVVPARACAHVRGEAEGERAGEAASPVKGLHRVRSGYRTAARVRGRGRAGGGDEDAWVDEDEDGDESEEGEDEGDDEDGEMTVVDDRECGGDEKLATPVPWRRPACAADAACAVAQRPRRRTARVLRKRGGGGGAADTVPGLYSREATPTPYSREERGAGREGEEGEQ
ncbi:hypothetical protein B0H14DRAFT_3864337, partial [Mycena olivaceomarginata]